MRRIICPACGENVAAGNFCTSCGAKLPEIKDTEEKVSDVEELLQLMNEIAEEKPAEEMPVEETSAEVTSVEEAPAFADEKSEEEGVQSAETISVFEEDISNNVKSVFGDAVPAFEDTIPVEVKSVFEEPTPVFAEETSDEKTAEEAPVSTEVPAAEEAAAEEKPAEETPTEDVLPRIEDLMMDMAEAAPEALLEEIPNKVVTEEDKPEGELFTEIPSENEPVGENMIQKLREVIEDDKAGVAFEEESEEEISGEEETEIEAVAEETIKEPTEEVPEETSEEAVEGTEEEAIETVVEEAPAPAVECKECKKAKYVFGLPEWTPEP